MTRPYAWARRGTALNSVMPGGFSTTAEPACCGDDRTGRGLTGYEVLDGRSAIRGSRPQTLEGFIIRYADRIVGINHDIDDAIRAGILRFEDIPRTYRSCSKARTANV